MSFRNACCAGFMAATVSMSAWTAADATPITIYQDNFENVDPGDAPAPSPGSYFAAGSNGAVVAAGAGSYPAATATGGSQFLRMDAAAGVGSRNTGIITTPATGVGSSFRLEMEVYNPSPNSGNAFGFGSELPGESGVTTGISTNTRRVSLQLRFSGTSTQIYRPNTAGTANAYSTIAGLTTTLSAWTKVVIEYVLGENQITLTVGEHAPVVITDPFVGIVASGSVTPVTSVTQVDTVFVATTSSGSLGYVDNILATWTPIPEPASLGLLGLGGVLMLVRRRQA